MRKLLFVLLLGSTLASTAIVVFNSQNKVEESSPIAEKLPEIVTSPLPAEPEPSGTLDDALASITQKELKKNLYYLASKELEGRMSGKKGNVTAAQFIHKQYESYGLNVMYHKFQIEQGVNPGPKNEQGDSTTSNIYAWIEGSDPKLKDQVVVVGAHMDHIGYGPRYSRASNRREVHPGADDNASGTVALMEIAQAFSMLKDKPKRTVVFQSYSAEEMGLIGSRYYCAHPVFPRNKENQQKMKQHVAMINMDMIGYLGRGFHFVGFSEGESSVDLGRIINELNGKYSFAKKITSRGSGGSDHASFYNKGVPVAFLCTGLHDYYHTPDDTADKINYKGVEQVARYAFELAYRVANTESPPRFNYKGFKPMSYDHDHGFGHHHHH